MTHGKNVYIRSEKPRAKYVIVRLVEDQPKLYLVDGDEPAWTPKRAIATLFDVKDDAVGTVVALRGGHPNSRVVLAARFVVERIVVDVGPEQARAREAS